MKTTHLSIDLTGVAAYMAYPMRTIQSWVIFTEKFVLQDDILAGLQHAMLKKRVYGRTYKNVSATYFLKVYIPIIK